jgi:hypothetical protein
VEDAFLEELRTLTELKGSYGITEILLKVKPGVLNISAITAFWERDAAEWVSRIETFTERAEHYVELATIAYRLGQRDACRRLLRTTISNAPGYGYHKDMSIYLDIEAISECAKAGSTRGREWLSRVAPIAKQAGKFTDGDETGNVVLEVAKACKAACPDVLFSMCVGLCGEEELYWADEVFAEILKVADLNDPFVAALAATSIDDNSQAVLRARAAGGDKNAEAIWNLVRFPSLPVALAGFETESNESSFEEPRDHEAADIEPKEVGRFLNKLDPPYEQHKFSRGWFSKQVEKGNAEAAYKALRDWMRERDYYVVDGDLLLEMIPFAEEFDGREEGFTCLCMAATQSYAWSRFGYSPKVREKIWSLLKQRYPDKRLEYVFRTCITSMYGTPLRKMTYIPASPGADFLVQFGRLAQAALVEADLGFIEKLMANLRIPSVDWFDSSHSALDSVIARAFWIGPLVCERASSELAKLLLKPETEGATLQALISGLSSEKLESRTIIWLLPMVRARRNGWNAPIDTIKQAVQTPSVLSETLLAEL